MKPVARFVYRQLRRRPPDFTIAPAGLPYLYRWWLLRSSLLSIYVHHMVGPDPDVMHDHPWHNMSVVLDGAYIERTPSGSKVRRAGAIVLRRATEPHRLTPRPVALTLFIAGPRFRDWGFHCPRGWVRWQDFVDPNDTGRAGRGCGEMG